MTTHPWGYIEVMIYVREGRDVKIVESHFLVVPCKSSYNCIFDRPFIVALDVVASMVHLKLKFHDLQGDAVTINADFEGAKRIYRVLQQE